MGHTTANKIHTYNNQTTVDQDSNQKWLNLVLFAFSDVLGILPIASRSDGVGAGMARQSRVPLPACAVHTIRQTFPRMMDNIEGSIPFKTCEKWLNSTVLVGMEKLFAKWEWHILKIWRSNYPYKWSLGTNFPLERNLLFQIFFNLGVKKLMIKSSSYSGVGCSFSDPFVLFWTSLLLLTGHVSNYFLSKLSFTFPGVWVRNKSICSFFITRHILVGLFVV